AIHHAAELADVDSFDAFLISPLDYAMGLKKLAAGAAEVRERRRNQSATAGAMAGKEKLVIAGGAGVLINVGLLLWRRKRASVCYRSYPNSCASYPVASGIVTLPMALD